MRADRPVQIDIIERLPTPYGLIRGGVAPDHGKTKNVARAFARTAQNEEVRYFGNVEVGRDVTLAELRETYDAVVLACGAPLDRPLAIPGADKAGVYGAAAFVGWYNGHPDFRELDPDLNVSAAAVIGVGNVAVDIARVLVKTPEEMAATDIADYAAETIHSSPLSEVWMCGRRGPTEAKFTNVELREMGHLVDAAPVLDPAQLPESVEGEWSDRDRRLIEKNLGTLREFSTMDAAGRRKRVHFSFFSSPAEILGDDRVEGLRLERTKVVEGRALGTGEFFEIECGLVLSAIGYRGTPLDGTPFDERNGVVENADGRVDDGLYAVGWIKRGPTGVIGSNKPDGQTAADQILADATDGTKPGRVALETILSKRGVRRVDWAAWERIEQAEIAAAADGAPRRKLSRIDDMLAVLD